MHYTEELHWILDKNGVRLKGDEEYRQNIEFVHSLGLKCDCVGWSRLNLSDPGTGEILAAIETFCKEAGWSARGIYTRSYPDADSDWFELVAPDIKEATEGGWDEIPAEPEGIVRMVNLKAYHELNAGPKEWREECLVPERFRNACLRLGIPDLRFCWARDKGKYAAEQYFFLYPQQRIPRMALDRKFQKEDTDRIAAAGGWLPRLAAVFSQLQQINLQDCYLAQDLPAGGMAYAYTRQTFSFYGRSRILIHRDTANLLIGEKVLSPKQLRPAAVVQAVPGGYVLEDTQVKPQPTGEYMEKMLSEYEKLKAAPRPVRQVTEKDALKVLRKAKQDQKADFQKALPKKTAVEAPYLPLEAYYRIANGCYLSDEYQLFSLTEAVAENEAFFRQLQGEELLESHPAGIVIGKCPDGDTLLLCNDGTVIRFSHEVPEILNQWPSLPQFIFDAISDGD